MLELGIESKLGLCQKAVRFEGRITPNTDHSLFKNKTEGKV